MTCDVRTVSDAAALALIVEAHELGLEGRYGRTVVHLLADERALCGVTPTEPADRTKVTLLCWRCRASFGVRKRRRRRAADRAIRHAGHSPDDLTIVTDATGRHLSALELAEREVPLVPQPAGVNA